VEIKVFDVKDGLGFALARRAGLLAGILSARGGTAVEQRARELELDEVLLQRRDKSAAFAELLARRALADDEVAYVGDDLTDLPILARAGLSFAPADAALEVRRAAHCTLEAPGGRGALREAVELLLRSRGQWAEVVAAVGRVQGVGASLGR
jgi:3-deoxy-D-manno-octulosonate 8-phosphate phosphatase (KDO 8-P phosphatase)